MQLNYKNKVKQIRKDILDISFAANACHIGSALSCVEILVDLYYRKLKEEDAFIFSKASGVATLYAILADKGYFSKKRAIYCLKNYPLISREVPGVLWSGGSLGHGLPFATGIALADKKKKVYVLMGDAEMQEGTTYESLLFKKQHKLNNLIIYCDWNRLQACGEIKNILNLPYNFLKSMGVKMIKTVKGYPIDFMSGDFSWHYRNLSKTQYEKAIFQLDH